RGVGAQGGGLPRQLGAREDGACDDRLAEEGGDHGCANGEVARGPGSRHRGARPLLAHDPRGTVMKKVCLALVLALGAAALAEDWVQHYKDRVAAFEKENEKLDAGTRSVVLVGDSLTEGWTASRVKRFLPTVGPRTLNRGIVSDGIGVNERGVLNRLDASVLK